MADTAEQLASHMDMAGEEKEAHETGEEKGDVELQEVPSKLVGNAAIRDALKNQYFEFSMAGTIVNLKLESINSFDQETTTNGASLMGRVVSRPERTKSQEEIDHEEKVQRIEDAMPDV